MGIFEAVVEGSDVAGVLDLLDVPHKHSRFRCVDPNHEDRTPAASFQKDGKKWRCWACQAHGNVIDLVVLSLGLDPKPAAEWIADRLGITVLSDRPSPSYLRSQWSRLEHLANTRYALPTCTDVDLADVYAEADLEYRQMRRRWTQEGIGPAKAEKELDRWYYRWLVMIFECMKVQKVARSVGRRSFFKRIDVSP